MKRVMRVEPDLPEIVCLCATLRRLARLVTQLYDEEFRPRLLAPQFALLSEIQARPGLNQSTLAKSLTFDKATLSRNLKVMERNGWIAQSPGADQRERGIRVTPSGARLLRAVRPAWLRAQNRLRASMSKAEWEALREMLRKVTNGAHRARIRKP